ncbi:MAG: RDD family protein [Planctomycetota bacterium]
MSRLWPILAVLLSAASADAGLHAASNDTHLFVTVPTTVETSDGSETVDVLVRRERFAEGRWQRVRKLTSSAVGLAVFRGDALVLDEAGNLRLIAPGRASAVTAPRPITALATVDGTILGNTADGPLAFDGAWAETTLVFPEPADEVAVEFAGSRYVFTPTDTGVSVQAFDASGTPVGDSTPIDFNVTPPKPPSWPVWLLLAMLAATAWGTMSLRSPPPPIAEAKVAPAGAGRRFFAGVVDIILGYPVGSYLAYTYAIDALPAGTASVVVLIGGFSLYFLLTAAVELATGRSIGKWIAGLDVVDLDGKPATLGALLTRNILRIADVWPIFPLVIVLVHPLRQRLGDAAARTMVVQRTPPVSVGPTSAPS